MPLLFPIAADARSALEAAPIARTQVDASREAGGPVALVSDWLRPSPAEQAGLQPLLDRASAHGYVQVYEDDHGRPAIAVTYWRPHREAPRSQVPVPNPVAPAESKAPRPARQPAKRKRHRVADTRQLDLFQGPDQMGHETPDPHNPGVVLVEEEGVGAAFGLASEATDLPPEPGPRRRRKR